MVTVGKLGETTSTPIHFCDLQVIAADKNPNIQQVKGEEKSQKYAHIT